MDSDDEPLVSVVMASYNAEPYIAETLASIDAQTYGSIEVIVVDDGSHDETPAIAEEFSRTSRRDVLVVRELSNEGPIVRRSRAITMSRGSLLCWLDADDVWVPTKVEEQVAIMRARPEVGTVYTRFEAFDSDTGDVLFTSNRDGFAFEGDLLKPMFTHGNFTCPSTLMFRRLALGPRGLPLREEHPPMLDDYYLMLCLALDSDVAFIPRILVRYRRHTANLSHLMTTQANFWKKLGDAQRDFLRQFPEARKRLGGVARRGPARAYAIAAWDELVRRRRARAIGLASRGLVRAPIYIGRAMARVAIDRYLRHRSQGHPSPAFPGASYRASG